MSCSRTQRSDASEAQTRGPSVSKSSILPLSHCAPTSMFKEIKANENINTYETFSGDAITIIGVAVAITGDALS